MKRNHERLLVATLAGIIIAGAAMYATQPIAGHRVAAPSQAAPTYEILSLRLDERA